MINSKMIEILKSLNIPVYWMEYDGDEKEYIIFQTNNVDDIRYFDDNAHAEKIEIGLVYWFNSTAGTEKINIIKELMKENEFIRLSEKDIKNEDYYGRSFRFQYIEYK